MCQNHTDNFYLIGMVKRGGKIVCRDYREKAVRGEGKASLGTMRGLGVPVRK